MVLTSTLNILERRKRKKKGPASLKTQCISAVMRNSSFFLNYQKKHGIHPFQTLPDVLITELREHEIRNVYVFDYDLQYLLINPRIKKIEIASEQDTPSFKKTWESLIAAKPILDEFVWERYPMLSDQPAIFDTVMSFESLKTLVLTKVFCNDSHLEKIAENLKSLRVLKVGLDEGNVSVRGLEAISKLDGLLEFHFDELDREEADHDVYQELFNQCLTLMPKLHVIGSDAAIAINHVIGYYTDFQHLTSISQLNLKKLLLKNSISVPSDICLPSLQELILVNPMQTINIDERFSSVKKLGFFKIGNDNVFKVLGLIGQQIESLTLTEDEETLNLGEVFRCCPNLKEFEMPQCPESLTMTQPFLPYVQNLETLSIDFPNPHVSSFPEGMLAHLLHAPDLKKVAFIGIFVTQEETDSIVKGVQQGTMLQNLECFQYYNYTTCDSDDPSSAEGDHVSEEEYFNPLLRDRFDVLLENLAIHCPNFVQLKENN